MVWPKRFFERNVAQNILVLLPFYGSGTKRSLSVKLRACKYKNVSRSTTFFFAMTWDKRLALQLSYSFKNFCGVQQLKIVSTRNIRWSFPSRRQAVHCSINHGTIAHRWPGLCGPGLCRWLSVRFFRFLLFFICRLPYFSLSELIQHFLICSGGWLPRQL